ncbi:SpoIIE family protein phosphatase [Streptomyces chromofuscus]|uniref:protein-serine/threonine phosphatase n=1 Tax=Streptomyces chromofuscus TaxID=42881 RepID=A0A7M2TIW4_STRCW|nr:SpoIIE family protein phosphatase [Streptomyces chromofuscus]QOV47883.1 SpoIIE family protein phosphatase [Streptomyces chromofuscus]GGT22822.1 hypothetical protein GCM10010254_49110 [Streptomyces chromofuscus]
MTPEYPFDEAATARAAIDAEGRVTEWGEGARRLLGWTADEVVGRPAVRLVEGAAPTAGGARWDGTLTLRHRDGRTVSVWLLAHRRPAPDGDEGWLVVTPLEADRERPADDPLDRAHLIQSPCATAIYDDRLRLYRMNDALASVIGLPGERLRGLRVTEISGRLQTEDIERQLHQVLTSGRGHNSRTYVPIGETGRTNAWLGRMAPITDPAGRVCGVCLTVHDFTEQHLAQERLQLVNEASVRIGESLDVNRTAQELADVCVPGLADFAGVDLLDPWDPGGEPELLAGPPTEPVMLRRAAHQSVDPGVDATMWTGRRDVYPADSPQGASLLTGRTTLADLRSGSLAHSLGWDDTRREWARTYGVHSAMSVPIVARGRTLGVAVLTRFRRPDPFTPDDRLLAEEITARAAVCIDNARRYTRERETALALQRSLLPRSLPSTAAVQACSRYLPAARSGVGGDWFDVIPLSGMRVAMVVGDVVGHGIQASATMGRLRTAVRTLADIDLAPDELLTHLDDLVVRLSEEAGADGSPGEVGATCLYAVYDPVSQRCTLARAGHPSPLMVRPGGTAEEVQLPAGPPLGLGGLPFEAADLYLPEGTVLTFYTDGLIQGHAPDVGVGLRLLRDAVSCPAASLDESCDGILHQLLPAGGARDDVALLLARTRGLPASQVATWDIPADPALVAPVRKQVVDQLGTWGLGEASFTTELVVSELVTNAIRYGAPPIRLRLIHDAATMICEVSDASHTAPHLRRAKTWDEGGRGLLLVAQLTQRWGSRHTPEGKTIWAEMALFEEE